MGKEKNADDFKIPALTFKKRIEKLFEQEKGAMKKIRIAEYPDLEKFLFQKCRDSNSLESNVLKKKAKQFAEKVEHKDFKSSNLCLENLRSLSLHHKANKKVWITSKFFANWFKQINYKYVQKEDNFFFFFLINARLAALS